MLATTSSPVSAANPAHDSGLSLLDALLRRRETFFDQIFEGREVRRLINLFLSVIVVLAAFYGLTMGAPGLTHSVQRGVLQMLASAVKVPALYLVSLAVCFPVLYVVLVLMGVKLGFAQTLALILMALALNAGLLASCAPIVVFFVITGSDYDFIKLLNVAIFAFSGCWSMAALWRGLQAMCEKSQLYPRHSIHILQVWVLIFGFVGTQMAWSLRPFVGSPTMEFELFRRTQSGNFYQAVWSSVVSLGRSK